MRSTIDTPGTTPGTTTHAHGEWPPGWPPVIGYEHLAELLGRTIGTLQADRCRKPGSLPPACTPPGTRQPRWLLVDVLAWLAEHREAPAKNPPGRPPKAKRRRANAQEGAA